MIEIELKSRQKPEHSAIIKRLQAALESSQWEVVKSLWVSLFLLLDQLTPGEWETLAPLLPLWADYFLKSIKSIPEVEGEIKKFYKAIFTDISHIPIRTLIKLYLDAGKVHVKAHAETSSLSYFREVFYLAQKLPEEDKKQVIELASQQVDRIEAHIFQFLADLKEPLWRKDREQLAIIRQRWQLRKTATTSHYLNWIQQAFSSDVVNFIAQLAKWVQEHLEKPPCPFAWIGIGSISRREMYPFSDLDCALLIADENCRNHVYFNEMIRLFLWRINLLCEPHGFRIDSGDIGHLLSAEKYLINTPQGLLQYINPEKLQKAEDFAQPEFYSLHRPVLLMASPGAESLLSEYQKLLYESFNLRYTLSSQRALSSQKSWKQLITTNSQIFSIHQIKPDSPTLSYPLYREVAVGYLSMHQQQWEKIKGYWINSNNNEINIKERFLGPLTFGCLDLALFYGIFNRQQGLAMGIVNILNQLFENKYLSEASVQMLRQAWEFLQDLRIKLHLHAEYQYDKPLKPGYKSDLSAPQYILTDKEWTQLQYIEDVVLTALYSSTKIWQVADELESIDLLLTAFEQELKSSFSSTSSANPTRLQSVIRMLAWYIAENKAYPQINHYWEKLPSVYAIQSYYIEQLLFYYQNCYGRVATESYFKQIPLVQLLQVHLNPSIAVNQQAVEIISFLVKLLGHYSVSPALYRYYLYQLPAFWGNYFVEQVEHWIVQQRKAHPNGNEERWNHLLALLYTYPKSDGRRVSINIATQAWQESLAGLFTNESPSSGIAVKVMRLPAKLQDNMKPEIISGWLQPNIVQMLIAHDGYFKEDQRAILSGRHNVIAIRWNKAAFHFKQQPELPGLEYAVMRLNHYLIGYGSPQVELVRFEVKIGKNTISYPVLISETISGHDLYTVLKESPERLKQLDAKYYSQLILASLLINPEDGKPDNYILNTFFQGDKTPYVRIIGIDNDHAFVEPLIKNAAGQTQVQVKTILYCLDNMLSPLHPEAVEEFLILDPGRLLLSWLVDLKRQHEAYFHLFTTQEMKRWYQEKRIKALMSDSESPVVIGIYLKDTLLKEIYQKMLVMQEALKENPKLSHLALLNRVDTRLGKFYGLELNCRGKSPLERFYVLTKSQYSSIMAGRLGTLANSRQILKSALQEVPTYKSLLKEDKYHPKQALLVLRTIREQEDQWQEARTAILQKNVEPFQKLPTDILKEKVINSIQFLEIKTVEGILDIELQKKILDAIKNTQFRRLTLAYCSLLTDERLKEILKHSRSLTDLNIGYCIKLTPAVIPFLAKYCPNLEKLDVSGLSWSKLYLDKLINLRRLTISDCSQLTTVNCPSRDLYWLKADGCFLLSDLQVPMANLQFASLSACPKLGYAALKEKHPRLIHCAWSHELIAAISEACQDSDLSKVKTLNLTHLAIDTRLLKQLMALVGKVPATSHLILENNQIDNNSFGSLAKIVLTYPNLILLNIKQNPIEHKYLFRLQEMVDKRNQGKGTNQPNLQLECGLDNLKTMVPSEYRFIERNHLQAPVVNNLFEQALTQQIMENFLALPSEKGLGLPVLHYQKLEILNLSNKLLINMQIQPLIRRLAQLSQLRKVNLAQSGLGQVDLQSLIKGLAKVPTLQTLNLAGNGLTGMCMEALRTSWQELSQLVDLNLSNNPLEGEGLYLLLNEVPFLKQLQALNLANCHLYEEECEPLTILGKQPQLTSLNLSNNKLGLSRKTQGPVNEGAPILKSYLSLSQAAFIQSLGQLKGLISLSLEYCEFTHLAMAELLKVLKGHTQLSLLKLRGNIVKENMGVLSALTQLSVLSLGLNKEKLLQSMTVFYMTQSFAASGRAQSVRNLYENCPGSEEVSLLAHALTHLTALTELNIKGFLIQGHPAAFDEVSKKLEQLAHLTHLDVRDTFLTARIFKWETAKLRTITSLSIDAGDIDFDKLKELTLLTSLTVSNLQALAKKVVLADIFKCLSALNTLRLQTLPLQPIKPSQMADICNGFIYLSKLTHLTLEHISEESIKLLDKNIAYLTSLEQLILEPNKLVPVALTSKIAAMCEDKKKVATEQMLENNLIDQLYQNFLNQTALTAGQILSYLDKMNRTVNQRFYGDTLFLYHHLFSAVRKNTERESIFNAAAYLKAKAYYAIIMACYRVKSESLRAEVLTTEDCRKIVATLNHPTSSIEITFDYISPAHGLLLCAMLLASEAPIFSIQELNKGYMDNCASLVPLLAESIKQNHTLNSLSLQGPNWTLEELQQISNAVLLNECLQQIHISNANDEATKLLSTNYFTSKNHLQGLISAQSDIMKQELDTCKQAIIEQINSHKVLLEKLEGEMNYIHAVQLLDSEYRSIRFKAIHYLIQNQRWRELMLEHFAQEIRKLPRNLQPLVEKAMQQVKAWPSPQARIPSPFWDNYPPKDKVTQIFQNEKNRYLMVLETLLLFGDYLQEVDENYLALINEMILQSISDLMHINRRCQYAIAIPLAGEGDVQISKQPTPEAVKAQPAVRAVWRSSARPASLSAITTMWKQTPTNPEGERKPKSGSYIGGRPLSGTQS